jgi:hypothetical protein
LSVWAFATFGVAAALADSSIPWQDNDAQGVITLYDKSGQVLTEGSVDTHPFAWSAVGSVPAKAPYDGAGHNATLMAYQPRQGVLPGLWSGDLLTATTAYTNPDKPTVLATASDFSLGDFIKEFPPQWDGLIQLRLLLGATGQSTPSTPYAALAIKVTGGNWSVVGATPATSSSGAARSPRSSVAPSDAVSQPSRSSSTSGSRASPEASRTTSQSGTGAISSQSPGAADSSRSAESSTLADASSPVSQGSDGGGGGKGWPPTWVALLGVLGLGIGIAALWRQWGVRS